MVVLPSHATDDQILAVARAWADLVALGDFDGAQDLLADGDCPPRSARERLESFGSGCPQEESPNQLFAEGSTGPSVPPSVVEREAKRVILGLDFQDCPRGLVAEFRLVPAGQGFSLALSDIRQA